MDEIFVQLRAVAKLARASNLSKKEAEERMAGFIPILMKLGCTTTQARARIRKIVAEAQAAQSVEEALHECISGIAKAFPEIKAGEGIEIDAKGRDRADRIVENALKVLVDPDALAKPKWN